MVRAGSIAARAEAADNLTVLVQRHAAAEVDLACADLAFSAAPTARRRKDLGVHYVRMSQTAERVARLREGVEHCGRERKGIDAEGVRRIGFGLSDRLAA